MSDKDSEHYLKRELYARASKDPCLLSFLESAVTDGFWCWNLEDTSDGWMSPRYKELFGYTDGEIPNTPQWWYDNIHPDDLQATLENLEKHSEDPQYPFDQLVRSGTRTTPPSGCGAAASLSVTTTGNRSDCSALRSTKGQGSVSPSAAKLSSTTAGPYGWSPNSEEALTSSSHYLPSPSPAAS